MNMLLHTMKVPLPGLSHEQKGWLWNANTQQRQAYNLGVELELKEHRSKYDMHAALTARRGDGRMPLHNQRLQRAGVSRGRDAVVKHRQHVWRLEQAVAYWTKQVEETADDKDEGKRDRAAAKLDRAQQRLARLKARGEKRLFRSRKQEEQGRLKALVYDERARLVEDVLHLPGGLPITLPDGWQNEMPEGAMFAGAVRMVDRTRRVTRRTKPGHRRWEAHLSFNVPVPEPRRASCEEEVLGIDMGVVIPVARSDGEEHHMTEQALTREAQLVAERIDVQKARARCQTGSRRWKKHNRRIAALYQAVTNLRSDFAHQTASAIAKTEHAEVAVEDLELKKMMASGKGTKKHPGTNVAATRKRNRALRRAAIARLTKRIARACQRAGTGFGTVPPYKTSQTCSRCGAEGQRETQALFECSTCDWVGNADHNAAVNVARIYWNRRPGRSSSDATPTTRVKRPKQIRRVDRHQPVN